MSGRRVLFIGVDEAGRGSLVGEMVIVAFAVEESMISALEELGVRDSKELSPEARAALYSKLSRVGSFSASYVSPEEIDKYNLNSVEAVKLGEALSRLTRMVGGARIARITVDKFGDVRAIRRSVLLSLPSTQRPEVVVEEKADSKYLEVAAASIVAKHLRDQRIRVLSKLYGVRGSGYPSDPRTVEWVKEILERGERPPVIRYSWYTIKKLGGPWVKKKGGRPGRTLDEFLRG
jgi:ribonuclease HII